jgi:hypothetical protein
VLVLLIKLLTEVLHEDPHHALVGIGHGQADPKVAQLVDGSDHADPRLHLLCLYRPLTVPRSPMLSSEVSHPQPSLVNVDYIFVPPVHFQEG